MRFAFLISAALSAAAAAAQDNAAAASARDTAALWTVCAGQDPRDAAAQIQACTAIIESGGESAVGLAVAHNNRGNLLADRGDADRAMLDYDEAIRLDPQNADAHYNRGLTYTHRGDYVRAIAGYDEAIRLNPRYSAAYNNRCMMRAMYLTRELDRARADCDAAIRLGGDGPRFLSSRGFLSLRQGRSQDAWNNYDAAIRGQPDFAIPLYGRGIAALRLGRTAEGLADLARATALDATIAQTFAADWIAP